MTARERARALSLQWGGNPNIQAVEAVILDAVEEERAACAKIVQDTQYDDLSGVPPEVLLGDLARAILARGPK